MLLTLIKQMDNFIRSNIVDLSIKFAKCAVSFILKGLNFIL
jgi:hypothetical protein